MTCSMRSRTTAQAPDDRTKIPVPGVWLISNATSRLDEVSIASRTLLISPREAGMLLVTALIAFGCMQSISDQERV